MSLLNIRNDTFTNTTTRHLKSGGQKKNNKLEGERKKNPVKKKANDFSLLLSGIKHFRGERNNDQIAGSDLRKKKGERYNPRWKLVSQQLSFLIYFITLNDFWKDEIRRAIYSVSSSFMPSTFVSLPGVPTLIASFKDRKKKKKRLDLNKMKREKKKKKKTFFSFVGT